MRQNQLMNISSRNTSVIRHTSTPNISNQADNRAAFFEGNEPIVQQEPENQDLSESYNTGSEGILDSEAFDNTEETNSVEPETEKTNSEPAVQFEIFQENQTETGSGRPPFTSDNPRLPSRAPLVIIETPSTGFDKENQEPQFLFPVISRMAAGDEGDNIPPDRLGGAGPSAGAGVLSDQERAVIKQAVEKTLSEARSWTHVYNPDNFPAEILLRNEEGWRSKVENAFADFVTNITKLLEDEATSEADKRNLQECKNAASTELTNYMLAYQMKTMSVSGTGGASSVNNSASSGSAPLAAAPSVPLPGNGRAGAGLQAARMAQTNADIEAEKISSKVKDLKEAFNIHDDWTVVDNHDIQVAMKEISSWRKDFDVIQETLYSMKKNVLNHGLNQQRLTALEAAVATLKEQLYTAIKYIKYEDQVRCLYSLNTASNSTVSYTNFSGGDDEDFYLFEKKLTEAFKTNRVKRDDQVKKLRECLKGQPKNLIPENMEDIDEALNILKEIYANSERLVKAKKAKLLALGPLPKPKSVQAKDVKDHLQWCMSLEVLLKDLVSLASESSQNENEVFSSNLIGAIIHLFPAEDIRKLALKVGRETNHGKMDVIMDHIYELRCQAQNLLPIAETEKPVERGKAKPARTKKAKPSVEVIQSLAVKLFKYPKRFESCKICNLLQAEGETEDLFEDHYANQVFGCPKFCQMTIMVRRTYIEKAKICRNCLDGSSNPKNHECIAKFGKKLFQCQEANCKLHFMLCENHQQRNQLKHERATKFWSDKGIRYTTIATLSSSPLLQDPVSLAPDDSRPGGSDDTRPGRSSHNKSNTDKSNNVQCKLSLKRVS